MNRDTAELRLKELFGFEHFHDDQWEAISRLLRGERVLMIERTGFGKSLCFQFPALMLEGVTIIFSPLIALMRDQVAGLRARGIPSECINSENPPEENERILRDARDGKVKILYIAPERQENDAWSRAVYDLKIAMVVIDEAHTISVWGHDFRPAFRRIVRLVRLLPPSTPVLAVTATATPRVQADIEAQIGEGLVTLRGDLLRDNFRFHVIEVESEEEKYIWLARHMNFLQGSGLIYTGTRTDTENLTEWLRFNGVDARLYNAGLNAEERKEVEHGLMESRWKCIVSTNALGMGIDKNDIRFIVHTQIPASPVHYYQEIGRAGRDGLPADILLFFNPDRGEGNVPRDCRLPLSFINNARPSAGVYQKVIEVIKREMLPQSSIITECNLKQTEFRVIRADLLEQNIIRELKMNGRTVYEYRFDAPPLDTSGFETLRRAKLADLDAMVDYVRTSGPRMKYLCEYLGDDTSREFTGCDNTTEPKWRVKHDERFREYYERYKEFERSRRPLVKAPRTKGSVLADGTAAAAYRETEVRRALEQLRVDPTYRFPASLVQRMVETFRAMPEENRKIDLVTAVPSRSEAVAQLAKDVAAELRLPYVEALMVKREDVPQREKRSGFAKRANVSGRFKALESEGVVGKRLLLIDDYADSVSTLAEAARVLGAGGATAVVPLALAATSPGDL